MPETPYSPLGTWADDICTECGHRRGYHDWIGCNDQLPNGGPCPCTVRVTLRGEPIGDRDNGNYIKP